MLRRTLGLLNFYPFGKKCGPDNAQAFEPPSATNSILNDVADVKKSVPRRVLSPQCPHCRYIWAYDRLVNWCPVDKSHTKSEQGLKSDWIYAERNPKNRYAQMQTSIHPKTGAWVNDDKSPSDHDEPRAAGITAHMMTQLKDHSKISRHVSGVHGYRFSWRTKFPWPS